MKPVNMVHNDGLVNKFRVSRESLRNNSTGFSGGHQFCRKLWILHVWGDVEFGLSVVFFVMFTVGKIQAELYKPQ